MASVQVPVNPFHGPWAEPGRDTFPRFEEVFSDRPRVGKENELPSNVAQQTGFQPGQGRDGKKELDGNISLGLQELDLSIDTLSTLHAGAVGGNASPGVERLQRQWRDHGLKRDASPSTLRQFKEADQAKCEAFFHRLERDEALLATPRQQYKLQGRVVLYDPVSRTFPAENLAKVDTQRGRSRVPSMGQSGIPAHRAMPKPDFPSHLTPIKSRNSMSRWQHVSSPFLSSGGFTSLLRPSLGAEAHSSPRERTMPFASPGFGRSHKHTPQQKRRSSYRTPDRVLRASRSPHSGGWPRPKGLGFVSPGLSPLQRTGMSPLRRGVGPASPGMVGFPVPPTIPEGRENDTVGSLEAATNNSRADPEPRGAVDPDSPPRNSQLRPSFSQTPVRAPTSAAAAAAAATGTSSSHGNFLQVPTPAFARKLKQRSQGAPAAKPAEPSQASPHARAAAGEREEDGLRRTPGATTTWGAVGRAEMDLEEDAPLGGVSELNSVHELSGDVMTSMAFSRALKEAGPSQALQTTTGDHTLGASMLESVQELSGVPQSPPAPVLDELNNTSQSSSSSTHSTSRRQLTFSPVSTGMGSPSLRQVSTLHGCTFSIAALDADQGVAREAEVPSHRPTVSVEHGSIPRVRQPPVNAARHQPTCFSCRGSINTPQPSRGSVRSWPQASRGPLPWNAHPRHAHPHSGSDAHPSAHARAPAEAALPERAQCTDCASRTPQGSSVPRSAFPSFAPWSPAPTTLHQGAGSGMAPPGTGLQEAFVRIQCGHCGKVSPATTAGAPPLPTALPGHLAGHAAMGSSHHVSLILPAPHTRHGLYHHPPRSLSDVSSHPSLAPPHLRHSHRGRQGGSRGAHVSWSYIASAAKLRATLASRRRRCTF